MNKANRRKYKEIREKFRKDHTSAYAAQAAFFFVLSLIPMLLLLLTLIQYTPVTKTDVMIAVLRVFPKTVNSLLISVINQVYNQSRAMIPITAIAALWSAGKGVMSMTHGLNCVYDNEETRNYFMTRIRSTLYTLVFIIIIVFSLVLPVFGNTLAMFINKHVKFLSQVMEYLLHMRAIVTIPLLILFSLAIYQFLPNHKIRLKQQLPGAVFTACGWMLASFVFSIYLDIFKGFRNMYGSLYTIILIMLWLYFCMYAILIGGEINVLLAEELITKEMLHFNQEAEIQITEQEKKS